MQIGHALLGKNTEEKKLMVFMGQKVQIQGIQPHTIHSFEYLLLLMSYSSPAPCPPKFLLGISQNPKV